MSLKRSIYSKFRGVLLQSVFPLTAAVVMPTVLAQPPIVVKNWPMSAASAPSTAATGSGTGLVFIAITPCRVMDTRGAGGSGKTGAFGAPSLVAGQARVVPVPSSNCGVPAAVAYSMNFVSITPAGQPVGWIAAWQDDTAWTGTVVLNAYLGGVVDNMAVVPAGADGGIQILTTDNGDLVIDMNGYYVQATTIQGPIGPQGPTGKRRLDQHQTDYVTDSAGPTHTPRSRQTKRLLSRPNVGWQRGLGLGEERGARKHSSIGNQAWASGDISGFSKDARFRQP